MFCAGSKAKVGPPLPISLICAMASEGIGAATIRALHEIAAREGLSAIEICRVVAEKKSGRETLTEALRSYVVKYFQEAASEEGHRKAGHKTYRRG